MGTVVETLKALPYADRLGRRNPLYYDRALETFRRLESAPLEVRRRFTDARLRIVLRSASMTSYGQRVGSPERVEDWPILDKELVRDNPTDFVRPRRLTLSASTSGTTGVPLRLRRSVQSVSVEQAAIDHVLSLVGVQATSGRLAILRADTVAPSGDGQQRFWRDINGGRRRLFSAKDLSSSTVARFAEGLSEYRPDCLLAYPSSLEALCLLLMERELQLQIPATLTSSEMLPPGTRSLAEHVLATQVVDLYGQAERVALAYSLHEGQYVVFPGYGHVELVLTEKGDGFDLYEIIGTSLWNLAMPLVRYRTGDIAVLPSNLSSVALDEIRFGVSPFSEIFGRETDYLVAPNGARIIGMNHIPRGVENIVRMQIVQETRRRVRILVLAKDGFGDEGRHAIEQNLSQKLPTEMEYSIEAVGALEKTSASRTPFLIVRPEAAEEG